MEIFGDPDGGRAFGAGPRMAAVQWTRWASESVDDFYHRVIGDAGRLGAVSISFVAQGAPTRR